MQIKSIMFESKLLDMSAKEKTLKSSNHGPPNRLDDTIVPIWCRLSPPASHPATTRVSLSLQSNHVVSIVLACYSNREMDVLRDKR